MDEVKIEIDKERIEEGVLDLAEKYKKDVSIPGFRKGKAPVQLIKSHMHDTLKAEVLQNTMQEEVVSLISKYEPFVYSTPRIMDVEEKNGGYEFNVELDVPPDIEIDLSNIDIEKKEIDTEEKISGEIERLRKINSELKPVKRKIKKGDIAYIDVSTNDKSISNYSQKIENDSLSKALKGLKAGNEEEVEVKFPDDFPIEDIAGEKEKATIKINEVKKEVLPKLDDEFARDLGFDNLDELKNNLSDEIEKETSEEEKEKVKEEIVGQLGQQIDDEKVSKNLIENLKQQDLSEEEAMKQAKEIMVLDIIALKNNLEVEDKELDEWMEKIAEEGAESIEELGEEAIDYIKLSILRDKSINYIMEEATGE